ncbi:hypothetical protein AB1Y20_004444 [Prymnesium parvum]|uniref:Uncharacterized protein n=1 Tax=Prymnesium parvum TaxID=97485 RepID=A0AB34IXN4_PRYPA
MVAELESSTYRRSFKFPSTPTRWNLKERNAFPQWHSDLRRVVRYATASGFLGSPRSATGARVGRRGSSPCSNGCAVEGNLKCYACACACSHVIARRVAALVHVENGYGSVADGNALYAWVLTHADDNKLSVQLQLKEALRKLTIADMATADEVDDVLEVIELSWPKIKGYDNSSAAPSIEYALGLFPSSYARASYISALQVHQDRGGEWPSFASFRDEIVERLRCSDVRQGVPSRRKSAGPHRRAPAGGVALSP